MESPDAGEAFTQLQNFFFWSHSMGSAMGLRIKSIAARDNRLKHTAHD